MPYMYRLKCVDDSYYTGSTWNLLRRVEQHQAGEGAIFTSKRLLVKLVYYEKYYSIKKAFQREKQIQKWSRRKKEALIKKDYEKLESFQNVKSSRPALK